MSSSYPSRAWAYISAVRTLEWPSQPAIFQIDAAGRPGPPCAARDANVCRNKCHPRPVELPGSARNFGTASCTGRSARRHQLLAAPRLSNFVE